MINRIFIISRQISADEPEENVYYTILTDPASQGSLDNAYRSLAGTSLPALGLALEINGPLSDPANRLAAAACFLPSGLRVDDQPTILLKGDSQRSLEHASAELKAYLDQQGLSNCLIHKVLAPSSEAPQPTWPTPGFNQLFESPEKLTDYYSILLAGDRSYNNDLFFYSLSTPAQHSGLAALRQIENRLRQDFPIQISLIRENQRLEKELKALKKIQASTEAELENHKQYLEVLRSTHPTKELQDYYTHEYEILPLWFKRLGHLVKVLTGKRTFRSLFRDDVKKYKD